MTYTYLTTDELVLVESYYRNNTSVFQISQHLKRSRQTIHKVGSFFKEGHTALDYYKQYKADKKRCGRRKINLPEDQQTYIKEKFSQSWTPDMIIGQGEKKNACFMRMLYR